ncbi:MAG: hypothetical protein ABWK01_07315 [Infirmifilum sp.]
MHSPLELQSARQLLLYLLRSSGFYVHMHAYEFLLGYDGRLIGVLLLEPSRRKATLYANEGLTSQEAIKKLKGVLRQVDPALLLSVIHKG